MTNDERTLIIKWLTHIDEDDFGIMCDVLDRCDSNQEALQYFLERAKEVHGQSELSL